MTEEPLNENWHKIEYMPWDDYVKVNGQKFDPERPLNEIIQEVESDE